MLTRMREQKTDWKSAAIALGVIFLCIIVFLVTMCAIIFIVKLSLGSATPTVTTIAATGMMG